MPIDWKFYAPAYTNWREYWPTAGRIVRGSALTVSLLLGVLTLLATGVEKWTGSPSTWADAFKRVDGVAWLVLILIGYGVGSLLYSARQLWHFERGGDSGEALCDLASVEVPVIHMRFTGKEVLGLWGQLLLTPVSTKGFEFDIRADVARLYMRQRRAMPNDDELELESLEFRCAISRLLRECELHDLVEINGDNASRTYTLRAPGKSAVRAARRLVRSRKLELGL